MRCNPNTSPTTSRTSRYEVVIIGAGASGLGAAKELEANGITSLVILEASNRIGGRIETNYPPTGGFIDLGAQWIHGQRGNILYQTTAPRGLISEHVSVDGEGDFYTENGELIDESLVTEVLSVCRKFKEECEEFLTCDRVPPPSMGHYLRARFEEYLNCGVAATPQERKIKEALFQWDVRWERIDNACDSLDRLSAKRWGDFLPCGGFYNMNPKCGMTSLVHSLRSDVKARIHLRSQVVEINYAKTLVRKDRSKFEREGGAAPVRVKCSNGSSYDCDYVIVTCSLGYLQSHKDKMFIPLLPQVLGEAISNLGFGVIDKIFLEFEEPFWNPDCTAIGLVWTGNQIPDFDRTKPDTFLVNGQKLKPEDYWYRSISSFDPVFGHKSMLCGWIGGAEAIFMESLSEKRVGEVCASLLRMFTNNNHIPNPIRVFTSKWATNQWFLGSYSHRRSSSDRSDNDLVQALNIPIYATTHTQFQIPLVAFAGEATSPEFYSTIHGALSSGVAQAKRYVNFLERLDSRRPEVPKSKL